MAVVFAIFSYFLPQITRERDETIETYHALVETFNVISLLILSPTTENRLKINQDKVLNYTWSDVTRIAGNVRMGGEWVPSACTARQKMVITIPYRQRETQLRALLAHLHPILQQQQLHYRILVVEQVK